MGVHEEGNGWSTRHYVEQLLMGFEWKMLFSIAGTIVAYIEGFYGQLMWGFLGLFVMDFISGIMKSRKNGVPITSKRLRESVTKLGAYMILITSLIIASKYEQSFVPIVTVTYYYFIFTELKSILENVEELGLKVPPMLNQRVQDTIDSYSETVVTAETVTTTSSNESDAIPSTTVIVETVQQTQMDNSNSSTSENSER